MTHESNGFDPEAFLSLKFDPELFLDTPHVPTDAAFALADEMGEARDVARTEEALGEEETAPVSDTLEIEAARLALRNATKVDDDAKGTVASNVNFLALRRQRAEAMQRAAREQQKNQDAQ